MKDADVIDSAQALPQFDRFDVACLRERVLSFEDDLRDLAAALLAEGRPLVAARLVASLTELNFPEDHVKDGQSAVRRYCRDRLACTTASDDPVQFADLVEALAALEPDNGGAAKNVDRACVLLLNQARRSCTLGEENEAIRLARRAAAAKPLGQANRIRCADMLADCGRPDEGAAVLLDSPDCDDNLLAKIAALLRRVDNWAGLNVCLERRRHSERFRQVFVEARERLSAQLNEGLDEKEILQLLDSALALVAISEDSAVDGEVVSAVLKRSRRAIRRHGRGDRLLLEEMCKKHLALGPEDREVSRRYVRLLRACGRHGEAREELLHQVQRDPHDEGMWKELSKCCAALGLKGEASEAENRSHAMAASGDFGTAHAVPETAGF